MWHKQPVSYERLFIQVLSARRQCFSLSCRCAIDPKVELSRSAALCAGSVNTFETGGTAGLGRVDTETTLIGRRARARQTRGAIRAEGVQEVGPAFVGSRIRHYSLTARKNTAKTGKRRAAVQTGLWRKDLSV